MAFKFSTGLRNGMMGAQGFKALMDNCFVDIYSGSEPATADADLSGATLLCRLSVSGNGTTGLTFGNPVGAIISKAASEEWVGTPSVTGISSFFRVVKNGDSGGPSTSALRIQGSIGSLGADMNISNNSFTSGTPFTLNVLNVALPTL